MESKVASGTESPIMGQGRDNIVTAMTHIYIPGECDALTVMFESGECILLSMRELFGNGC